MIPTFGELTFRRLALGGGGRRILHVWAAFKPDGQILVTGQPTPADAAYQAAEALRYARRWQP